MRAHHEEPQPARASKPSPASVPSAPVHGAGRLLALQRLAGNQAVQGLLSSPAQRWWGGDDEGADSEGEQAEAQPLADTAGSAVDWLAEQAGAAASWVEETWSAWTGGPAGGEDGPDAQELPEVAAATVECEADEAVGHGKGSAKQVSLHGKTVSNYNHGEPIPAPFPSSVTVTTGTAGKGGKQKVFSAHGTFDVTFDSNPSITLPSVPSGLTPCQTKAVQAFIDGPLNDHENDHAAAFRSHYDGTFTATVNVANILDTPTYRKRAMENPVNAEDVKRAKAGNDANKALDTPPWKRTVTGMDCTD